MKKTALFFPIAIKIFIVVFLLIGWFGYAYEKQVIMFPLIVGISTCLFCLILILSNKTVPANKSSSIADDTLQMKKDLHSLGSLLVILPLVGIFGFTAGFFIYLVGFLKLRGESWYVALALGIGSILFINGLFLRILNISLPVGLLGW